MKKLLLILLALSTCLIFVGCDQLIGEPGIIEIDYGTGITIDANGGSVNNSLALAEFDLPQVEEDLPFFYDLLDDLPFLAIGPKDAPFFDAYEVNGERLEYNEMMACGIDLSQPRIIKLLWTDTPTFTIDLNGGYFEGMPINKVTFCPDAEMIDQYFSVRLDENDEKVIPNEIYEEFYGLIKDMLSIEVEGPTEYSEIIGFEYYGYEALVERFFIEDYVTFIDLFDALFGDTLGSTTIKLIWGETDNSK